LQQSGEVLLVGRRLAVHPQHHLIATSTVDKLLDYILNTPEDPQRSYACVQQRYSMIEKNFKVMGSLQ
jgi:4-O-beta-D-mannosyl-D-glucose phosphorylase